MAYLDRAERSFSRNPLQRHFPLASVALLVALLCLLILPAAESLAKPSSIQLRANGYEGVVVAIRDDVPESDQLIAEIERMFTDASLYLYNTTNQRAYFRNVTVLLPLTWNTTFETVSPENYTYDAADVIVTPLEPSLVSLSSVPPPPLCKHFEGCGKQAAYIQFTSEFLTRNKTKEYYGNIGRVLVHEWGHFRWGLFNEYPDELTDRAFYSEFFYSPTTGEFQATRCTGSWDAINVVYDTTEGRYRECVGNSTVGYEDGCISVPTPNQSIPLGSIMYGYTNIEQVTKFCDDGPDDASHHVADAPNKHNRLCDRRSSWEVMREHPDFADGNNPPTEIPQEDLRPTIRFARIRPLRLVLVLDTSGSMRNKGRITKQSAASRNFIMTSAVDGMYLGIVHFDSSGHNLTDGLVQVSSEDRRVALARLIPTVGEGGTCIGCGLEQALLGDNIDPAGSTVILITDGVDADKSKPKTEEMKRMYAHLRIKINSVAFSNEASEVVPELSSVTGGGFFLQTDDIGSTGLHDAFHSTVAGYGLQEDQSIQLFTESLDISINPVNEVVVDSTIGYRTTFEFIHYNPLFDQSVINVIVTSPSGCTYDEDSAEYREQMEFNFIIVEIRSIAEEGTWRFNISSKNEVDPKEVLVSVASRAVPGGDGAIIANSVMSSTVTDLSLDDPIVIYSEVRQGLHPVLNCDVMAIVERPAEGSVELELYDNGAGADITAGDGIYSRYFTNFAQGGFYGVQISITNDNGAAVILKPSNDDLPYSRAQPYVDPRELLNGNISKFEEDLIRLPGTPPPSFNRTKAPRFIRRTSGGSNRVSGIPEGDFLPPARISDLMVNQDTNYPENSTGTMTIVFTAPGDNLDFGTATSYIMKSSPIMADLQDSQSSLLFAESQVGGDLPGQPKPFGEIEEFAFNVTLPENETVTTIYVTVTALDENNNAGDPSNIGHTTFRRYIPKYVPDLPTTRAPHETTTTAPHETTAVVAPEVSPQPEIQEIGYILHWIIICVFVGICLFISVSSLVYVLFRSKYVRRGNQRCHEDLGIARDIHGRSDSKEVVSCNIMELRELDDDAEFRTTQGLFDSESANGIVREPFVSSQILTQSAFDSSTGSSRDDRSCTTTSSDSNDSSLSWGYDNLAFGAYLSGTIGFSVIPRRYYHARTRVKKYDPSFDVDNIHGQYF